MLQTGLWQDLVVRYSYLNQIEFEDNRVYGSRKSSIILKIGYFSPNPNNHNDILLGYISHY